MKKVTIAKGDGIGPEIMEAVLKIIKKSNAPIDFEEIEIGEKVYCAPILVLIIG
jgi:isocitrate dehydrogenase